MRRRTLLRAAPAIAGSVLAGCLGGGAATGDPTDSPRSTTPGTGTGTETTPGSDTTATADSSPDELQVALAVENSSDRPRAGSVRIVRTRQPACRFNERHQCGMPARETVALDAGFDLAAGGTRTFDAVAMGIEGGAGDDNTYVDTYVVEVATDAGRGRLLGLEAGAASTVGRADAGAYPWRVAGRRYRVRGVVAPEDVTVALRAGG